MTHKQPMSPRERADCMALLCQVAKIVGRRIKTIEPTLISDTVQVCGHQFSTIDDQAKLSLREEANRYLGGIFDTILEESDIPLNSGMVNITGRILVADAVEGSTNAKRGLSSHLRSRCSRPLFAGTSIMLLETRKLSSIAAAAFYDWASDTTLSCFRTEQGSFVAFVDDKIIYPRQATQTPRDSQLYAVVPIYSHTNIEEHACLETALLQQNIRASGGSRSSAQDLLDVLSGQADAYVDLRTNFTQQTENRDETLRAWDVGAVLPILDGVGFIATDYAGISWQERNFNDSLSLIVARTPELWRTIRQAVASLPFLAIASDSSESSISITSFQKRERNAS